VHAANPFPAKAEKQATSLGMSNQSYEAPYPAAAVAFENRMAERLLAVH